MGRIFRNFHNPQIAVLGVITLVAVSYLGYKAFSSLFNNSVTPSYELAPPGYANRANPYSIVNTNIVSNPPPDDEVYTALVQNSHKILGFLLTAHPKIPAIEALTASNYQSQIPGQVQGFISALGGAKAISAPSTSQYQIANGSASLNGGQVQVSVNFQGNKGPEAATITLGFTAPAPASTPNADPNGLYGSDPSLSSGPQSGSGPTTPPTSIAPVLQLSSLDFSVNGSSLG